MFAFHLARSVYANISKVHIKSASAKPAHVWLHIKKWIIFKSKRTITRNLFALFYYRETLTKKNVLKPFSNCHNCFGCFEWAESSFQRWNKCGRNEIIHIREIYREKIKNKNRKENEENKRSNQETERTAHRIAEGRKRRIWKAANGKEKLKSKGRRRKKIRRM